jgi:predicted nucleic acid-binding protein
MKILLDSNVAIDVILQNEPFYESASIVIGLSKGGVDLFVSASTVTDIYYIVSRSVKSKKIAMDLLKDSGYSLDRAKVI